MSSEGKELRPASDRAITFTTRSLDSSTWPDFVLLAEKHNGVWGGCWCMFYHIEKGWSKRTASQNRSEKELRVRDGTAHASLVYDGADAVGWCQYGPPGELPRVKNRKDYLEGKPALPDWRITCFFVDRKRRRRGVASTALKAALEAIAAQGGGRVEAYPEDTDAMGDRGSFLWSGTVSMFEREGFNRVRPLGKRSWVMTKVVRGAIHR